MAQSVFRANYDIFSQIKKIKNKNSDYRTIIKMYQIFVDKKTYVNKNLNEC